MRKITEALSFLLLGCIASGCVSMGGSYTGAGAQAASGSAAGLLALADRYSLGKPEERDFAKARPGALLRAW